MADGLSDVTFPQIDGLSGTGEPGDQWRFCQVWHSGLVDLHFIEALEAGKQKFLATWRQLVRKADEWSRTGKLKIHHLQ